MNTLDYLLTHFPAHEHTFVQEYESYVCKKCSLTLFYNLSDDIDVIFNEETLGIIPMNPDPEDSIYQLPSCKEMMIKGLIE